MLGVHFIGDCFTADRKILSDRKTTVGNVANGPTKVTKNRQKLSDTRIKVGSSYLPQLFPLFYGIIARSFVPRGVTMNRIQMKMDNARRARPAGFQASGWERSIRKICILANLILLVLLLGSSSLSQAEETSLFNGKDLTAWKEPLGTWAAVRSVTLDAENPKGFTVQPGTGVMLSNSAGKSENITSHLEHGDAHIQFEFNVPQGSNSGVYLQGRYEVQILDSFGKTEIGTHDCGAIYQRWDPKRGKGNEGYEGHAPKVNACRAPGEWQSLDITFKAPRFDASGNRTKSAKFIQVLHNGQVIHENVEMTGPTRGSKFEKEAPMGPIHIQGDHGPVAFRHLKVITR